MSAIKPSYVLHLEPLTGPGWSTSPELRLKILLKRIGRTYGFKCHFCSPEPAATTTPNAPTP